MSSKEIDARLTRIEKKVDLLLSQKATGQKINGTISMDSFGALTEDQVHDLIVKRRKTVLKNQL